MHRRSAFVSSLHVPRAGCGCRQVSCTTRCGRACALSAQRLTLQLTLLDVVLLLRAGVEAGRVCGTVELVVNSHTKHARSRNATIASSCRSAAACQAETETSASAVGDKRLLCSTHRVAPVPHRVRKCCAKPSQRRLRLGRLSVRSTAARAARCHKQRSFARIHAASVARLGGAAELAAPRLRHGARTRAAEVQPRQRCCGGAHNAASRLALT